MSKAESNHFAFFRALIVLLTVLAQPAFATQYHVTTTGTSSGTGALLRPWSLAHALTHPSAVQPGDTIWVHGGTYVGHFTSDLTGTSSKPIIVRAFGDERVTLEDRTGADFNLTLHGGYAWFWGFEVRSTSANRTNRSGIIMAAPGLKCINMVIHDCLGSGVNPFKEAVDAEVYGCLVYYNGRQTERPGYAYGSYTQNVQGRKLIRDNIYHHNWSMGIHAYESGGADLDNMLFEGNAIFNNGVFYEPGKFKANVFLGGDAGHTADNNEFRNNYTYYSPSPGAGQANVIGHVSGARSTKLIGNFWISPGYYAINLNSTGNTITGNVFLGFLDGVSRTTYTDNTYYTSWPSRADDIIVRPNAFEPGRGHVYAYNWDQSGSIAANLSPILRSGDRFEVRDALNYYGSPVASGTYAGGTISIPMTGLKASAPEGNPVTPPIHPAPRFGAFVVVSTSRSTTLPVGGIDIAPDTLGSNGGDVTVTWVSTGATAVNIFPGIGDVAGSGSMTVPVAQTTKFVLTLKNTAGTSSYNATVVVRPPRPAVPVLQTPLNGSSNQPTSITLRWEAAANASSYQLQCSRDASFATVLFDVGTEGTTRYAVQGLLHGRTYYWRVKSKGLGGESNWSAPWSFTTGPIPVTSLPVNLLGTPPEEQLIEVQLQKPGATDSAFMTMWVYDADASNEGELSINGNTPLTLFGPHAQSANNQVVVPITYALSPGLFRNGANRLLYAHTRTGGFRVDSIRVTFRTTPVGRIDVEPDTLASGGGNVTVNWTSTGATSIGIAPSPGAVAASGSAVVPVSQTTTFVLTLSNAVGTTTRRATAVVLTPRPPMPILQDPSNGSADQPLSLAFRWNAAANASSYQIHCSQDSSFSALVIDAVSGATPGYSAQGLLHGRTYYWRVRSRGVGGESGWSETWSFATVPISATTLPVSLRDSS